MTHEERHETATEPDIVLLYEGSCPNVEATRQVLREACRRVGIAPRWREMLLEGKETPESWRGHGSPTVLVGGRDVMGQAGDGQSPACRIYEGPNGLQGVPPLDAVESALRSALASPGASSEPPSSSKGGGHHGSSTPVGAVAPALPAVGLSLLPSLACPACWPAYAGLLGSLGLGFLADRRWLFSSTVVALLLALGTFAFRARSRRGFGPLWLGMAASGAILVGKFLWEVELLHYAGLAALVAAAVWNAWPRAAQSATCSSCTATSSQPAQRGGGPSGSVSTGLGEAR